MLAGKLIARTHSNHDPCVGYMAIGLVVDYVQPVGELGSVRCTCWLHCVVYLPLGVLDSASDLPCLR